MTETVLISVIIPAYNCADTISQSIESALRQKVPLEILVLDDCSTDSLDSLMENYADRPEIIYIHNEKNIGAAATRNRGVKLAKGKYVAFLDADDWWEDGKLEEQLKVIEREKAVLCATARQLILPNGQKTGRCIEVKEKLTYSALLLHNSINCSSVLMKAEVAREFPMEHEDSHEDYITWLKVLRKYERAVAVNKPYLNYRLSNGGKSGNKLKSAGMTYKVYRYVGFNTITSVILFCTYAVNGVLKYGKAYLKK